MGQKVAAQAHLLVVHQLDAQMSVLHQWTLRLDDLDELVPHGASGHDSTYRGQTQQQERGDIACKEMSAHAVHQLFHRRPPNRPASPPVAGDENLLLPAPSSNSHVGSIIRTAPAQPRSVEPLLSDRLDGAAGPDGARSRSAAPAPAWPKQGKDIRASRAAQPGRQDSP